MFAECHGMLDMENFRHSVETGWVGESQGELNSLFSQTLDSSLTAHRGLGMESGGELWGPSFHLLGLLRTTPTRERFSSFRLVQEPPGNSHKTAKLVTVSNYHPSTF